MAGRITPALWRQALVKTGGDPTILRDLPKNPFDDDDEEERKQLQQALEPKPVATFGSVAKQSAAEPQQKEATPQPKEQPKSKGANGMPSEEAIAAAAKEDTAYYLKHTGKTQDDRSEKERYFSARERAASGGGDTGQGYTNDSGQWIDGKRVDGKSSPAQQAQQAQPAQPAPVEKQPELVNKALERTGSSYRVPTQDAGPQIEDKPLNHRASGKELRQDIDAGYNRAIELAGQTGGKTGTGEIAARNAEKQAQITGAKVAYGEESAREAHEDYDRTRAERAEFDKMARERLAKMSALVDHPPDQSRGKVFRIIGAVLSASPKQGAGVMGAAMGAIGQSMAGDMDAWKQEIAANQAALNSTMAMSEHQTANGFNDIKARNALRDMTFSVYDTALEQAKQEGASEQFRATAAEVQNGLRTQYAEGLWKEKQQEAASAAKKKASAEEEKYWKMGMPELAARAASNTLGEVGQKVFAARAKTSRDIRTGEVELQGKELGLTKTQSEIAKTEAEAERILNEAKGEGENAEILPGYQATVKLPPGVVTELAKNRQATPDLIGVVGKLREIRARNQGGTWNSTDETEAKRLMSMIPAMSSQMSGAGAPSEGEREAFAESIVDPTGFYARKDPIEIYDTAIKNLESGFQSRARSIGVVPKGKGSGLDLQLDKDKKKDEDEEKKRGEDGKKVAARGVSGGW